MDRKVLEDAVGDKIAALTRERDEARAEVKQYLGRMFPIQQGPSIPWFVIAPFDGQCRRNHGGQSLERMAQRGGLGVVEALAVLDGVSWTAREHLLREPPEANITRLLALVRERTGSDYRADNARLREALELMTPAPGFPKCDSRCSSNAHAYDEDNRCDCGMEEIRMNAERTRAALAGTPTPNPRDEEVKRLREALGNSRETIRACRNVILGVSSWEAGAADALLDAIVSIDAALGKGGGR